jgi:hypothetical protein
LRVLLEATTLVSSFSCKIPPARRISARLLFLVLYESHVARERKQRVTGRMEIWIGGTGWPSDGGSNNGRSEAGTSLAAYCSTIVAPFGSPLRTGSTYSPSRLLMSNKILCRLIKIRMLTRYQRNWKPDVTRDDGSTISERHWGAMHANRTRKYEIDCYRGTNDRNSTAESSVGPC